MIRVLFIISISISILFSSIDDEIEAINRVPVEDRFKLMNRLKEKIAKMQEKKRLESIEKLKHSTNGELIIRDRNNSKSKIKNKIENSINNYTDFYIEDGGGDD